MPFQPSTSEELRSCKKLVASAMRKIRSLVRKGKNVHVIWDMDQVLVSGRSDDVFTLVEGDLKAYFTYEERLFAEPLEEGPWAPLAAKCGEPGYQTSQDVVTARSSFPALRAQAFLLGYRMKGIPVRWSLYLGHQSKAESYRIILHSFQSDSDTHIVCVDDAPRHMKVFATVAAELGMTGRCHGFVAPRVRAYGEDELRAEIEKVLAASDDAPPFFTRGTPPTRAHIHEQDLDRGVLVVPNAKAAARFMFLNAQVQAIQHIRDREFPAKPDARGPLDEDA